MLLYYLLGDRTEALKQYQRCETALREDLSAQSDRHTQALYQQILADQHNLVSTTDAQGETAVLLDVLSDLKQIQVIQTDLLRQVQHNIRLIEETLSGEHYALEQNSGRLDSLA